MIGKFLRKKCWRWN